ncbi:hypothetical protein CPJCM30710_09740 [Clostridium polyendosporum]|uniref:EpsG family protein n=2 Tax=Clostridium polyendosporum TaxID=69208 RepID=A0A919VL70_9CLOT|nr:hypothetical protein CPJCM30710_09740 [Clostridium polyendosporum]
MLFFVAGFRYNTGYDYDSYKDIFNRVNSSTLFNMGIEFGFTTLCYILKLLGLGFEVLIFIIALVSLVFKYKSIKQYSIYPFISLIIYFSANFIIQDFGQIRQGLAIAFSLYSIRYIKERRLVSYLILMAFAIAFHYSAVIFLPFYFIGNVELSNRKLIIIVAFSFVIYAVFRFGVFEFIFTKIINLPYVIYKYKAYSGAPLGFVGFTFVFRVAIFIAFLLLERDIRNNYTYYNILKNGYFLSIIMYIIFNVNEGLATRGALYFKTFEILLIPSIVYAVKNKIVVFNAILVCYLYTLKDLVGALMGQTEKFIPYKNLIFEFMKKLI